MSIKKLFRSTLLCLSCFVLGVSSEVFSQLTSYAFIVSTSSLRKEIQ